MMESSVVTVLYGPLEINTVLLRDRQRETLDKGKPFIWVQTRRTMSEITIHLPKDYSEEILAEIKSRLRGGSLPGAYINVSEDQRYILATRIPRETAVSLAESIYYLLEAEDNKDE